MSHLHILPRVLRHTLDVRKQKESVADILNTAVERLKITRRNGCKAKNVELKNVKGSRLKKRNFGGPKILKGRNSKSGVILKRIF
jgi:hypothetical protein